MGPNLVRLHPCKHQFWLWVDSNLYLCKAAFKHTLVYARGERAQSVWLLQHRVLMLHIYRCDHIVTMQSCSSTSLMHIKWKQFRQSQMQIWLESEFCTFRKAENVRKILPWLTINYLCQKLSKKFSNTDSVLIYRENKQVLSFL